MRSLKKERWLLAVSELWLTWSFTVMVVTVTAGSAPHCSLSREKEGVTAGGDEGLVATCYLRTLQSEILKPSKNLNSTLSAVNHSIYVTSLKLLCSKQVVFESEIEPDAFSAFTRLVELEIDSCKLKSLPDRSFIGLPQLRRLSIHTHHEDWPGAALSFKYNTLAQLPRLENLDLSSSEIWQLPQNSLCALNSLSKVNLKSNKLHQISDIGLMPGCGAPIVHLLLSHNEIDEFPPNSLPTPHIHSLHMDHNKLARIDDYAFKGLSEMKELVLSFNKLVALPKTAFLDLYQLRSLDLANNSLSSFPPAIFTSLERLLALNVSHNRMKFSQSNPEPFIGLIRLVVLNLSFNEISHFGDRILNHLYSLQVLLLSHNRISYLSNGVFSTLTNLYKLDLSHNTLTTLDSGALRGLSVLTHLLLNDNYISEIPSDSFHNCSSLERLSMTNNKLESVPNSISHLPLLQELDLSNNKISLLERTNFKGLNNIKKLSLSSNSISNITVEVIPSLPKLEFLDLSHNNIVVIEHRSFEPLTELLTLNLSHNHLPDINGLVSLLFKLQNLNVSNNRIGWFDYALIPSNLYELDLSHNFVNLLENHYELHDKSKLRRILASNNNISEISSSSIPNGIEVIDFSHNFIDYVGSNTFLMKERVNEINFQNNLLTRLEESSLRLPPRSSEATSASPPLLLLSNNPLTCDCGAEWLLRAARDANGNKMLTQHLHPSGSLLPRLGNTADVKCTLPGIWEEATVSLVSVDQHQFLCTYRRHCFTLCHCCDFDACDCEQTCPNNCNCYHDQSWTHNIVDCGKQNWTVMPMDVPMDVTEAYLDGNNLGNLTSHALIGRKNLLVLHLNNSNIIDIQNRTFNGLQNLQVLRLDHNYLKRLRGFEFVLLHDLLELYVNDNQISFISNTTFTPLRALEVLHIENNFIKVFPVWNLALNPFLIEVAMYHNRWSCECNFLANLKAWLESNRIKASRVNEMRCYHNRTGEEGPRIMDNIPGHCDHYVSTTHMNQLVIHDYVMFSSISIAVILFVAVLVLSIVLCRRRIKLWANSQYSKHVYLKSSSCTQDREKLFDVFISHSNKDSAWVYGVLTPELENEGYRICCAYRNCSSPTSPIVAQAISEGISCSQKIIIVLSRGLVDSEWCKYDFKSTHVDAISSLAKKNIVLISLENISKTELDAELSSIIKKASYSFKPREPRFWEKLKRALPSLRHRRRYDDMLGKSISSPLMATNVPPTEIIKFTAHPNKNLTLNPYWETAMTSNIPGDDMKKPDLGVPSWVEGSPVKGSASPRTVSPPLVEGLEHTYMSVSECGDNNTVCVGAGPSDSFGVRYTVTPSSGPQLNGTVPNFKSPVQSSPPLLPLHHQHLVHNQLVNFQEVPQYQTPINQLPPNSHFPQPVSGAQTLHHPPDQRNNLNIYVNDKSKTSLRNGNMNPISHRDGVLNNLSGCGDHQQSTCLQNRHDNSPDNQHYKWIHQNNENLPNSNKSQTYYV